MIALNIVLMTTVIVGIVSLLAWAIVSDRRSKRAAGAMIPRGVAPLTQNLEMPRELRVPHRGGRSYAPVRRPAARSTTA
jgi:hypothetical protein